MLIHKKKSGKITFSFYPSYIMDEATAKWKGKKKINERVWLNRKVT